MARVNWQFLQHEGSTDVITFDYADADARARNAASAQREHCLDLAATPLHGEAFICVADAVKQAREFKTTWQSEVIRYAVHAVLHLRGYDDLQPAKRRVMKREENRLVRELAASFDFSQLEAKKTKP
jgi:probable rRNA maturation factor